MIAISGAVIAPTLYFFGFEQTTASHAAVLLNGEMVFTILFVTLFLKEKLTKRVGKFGVILVVVGVVIITTNLQFLKLTYPEVNMNLET